MEHGSAPSDGGAHPLRPLSPQVMKTVDVSYGGENGFNQAIELSADTLQNVKFVQEKKLISKYFEEISQDTGAGMPTQVPAKNAFALWIGRVPPS